MCCHMHIPDVPVHPSHPGMPPFPPPGSSKLCSSFQRGRNWNYMKFQMQRAGGPSVVLVCVLD